MRENFYEYQRNRLMVLLGWGLGSGLVGVLMWRGEKAFWQQFGLQSLTWGMIDAALAAFGLNSAYRKGGRFRIGELGEVDEQKEARGFLRILLVNTVLDVGYVATGAWLVRRFQKRADRRGMGVGILVQGLWLLAFDGLLSAEVWNKWVLPNSMKE